jgi:hypothetical protein
MRAAAVLEVDHAATAVMQMEGNNFTVGMRMLMVVLLLLLLLLCL